jgi:hypothetical protein
MNNHPVLMDVGQNRAPTYRGPLQGRVADLDCMLGITCYNCGKKGHMVRQCLKPRTSHASEVQSEDQLGWNDHDSEIGYPTMLATTERSAVSQVREQLKAITLDQKCELADELGVLENFQSA